MFIFFIFLPAIIMFYISRKADVSWRESVLSTAVAWGISIVAITEFLSIFKAITFNYLLISWILTFIVLIVYCILSKSELSSASNKSRLVCRSERLPIFLFLLLCSVAFTVVTTGFIAIISPPNNWDSMSYHMARVVNWIQNQNVGHYPTNYLPQLYQNPWSEFAIMHFQILTGGDRFANLVQWFSMVGSLIAVSLISKLMGASLRGQILSVVTCTTIPMGILQASSTQNDYTLSFWLLCFVYYGLARFVVKSYSKTSLFYLGSSLGLAVLTKGTSYIYVLPFVICFFWLEIRRQRWSAYRSTITVAIIVLSINIGHYIRNLSLFGSPLGPRGEKTYLNEVFSIPHWISNLTKNIALILSTPARSVNLRIIDVVEYIHHFLGIDINDPRTSATHFDLPSKINHEDFATNPLFLFLIIGTIYLFLFSRKRWDKKNYLRLYLFCFVSAFLLFTLLLKWQMFHLRLLLPLFILSSPFIGIVLSSCLNYKVIKNIALTLLMIALPWLLFNETRPLIMNSKILETGKIENIFNTSRIEQYFIDRKEIKNSYVDSVNLVQSKSCSKVGLLLKGSGEYSSAWEYPFWVLFHQKDSRIRFISVGVDNESAKKYTAYSSNGICAVISDASEEHFFVAGNSYAQTWSEGMIRVLSPSANFPLIKR